MKRDDFLAELTELLEADDDITIDSALDEAEGFDSLAILSLVAMIDEHFDMIISGEELSKLKSVKGLISLIGEDKIN